MIRFTPGPWEAVTQLNSDKHVAEVVVVDTMERIICKSHHPAYFSLKETEANARLIAAAPDLLEAAILVATDLENAVGNKKTLAACLRVAIAKAKGE